MRPWQGSAVGGALIALGLTLALPATAVAQAEAEGLAPLYPLLTLALFTAVPLLFLSATSFVKISVVFSILRNALGTGQVPSGVVIGALAAILSLYVMAPVGHRVLVASAPAMEAIDPSAPLADLEALGRLFEEGIVPLREFLERHAGERERALFAELSSDAAGDDEALGDDHVLVLLPAFLITELAEAFQIAFLVFLPFLVVDLVIANVLMSLGMQSLDPTRVSLPFKLLLFVLVDGWYLLARALMLGYA